MVFGDFLSFYASICMFFVGFGDEFDVYLTLSQAARAGDSLVFVRDVYSG